MPDFEAGRIAQFRNGRVTIVRNFSTAQLRNLNLIKASMKEDLSQVIWLTDADGVQQYVHGVTPMDNTVRVGHSVT